MARKVLVAVATELDGHAGAEAFTANVFKLDYRSIRNMLMEKLHDGNEDCVVVINTLRKVKNADVWEAYGYTYDEDYQFAVTVAPSSVYNHISARTG